MARLNLHIIEGIQRWDVTTFLRCNRLLSQTAWVDAARMLSKTADGWGYLLIPMVLYIWSPSHGKQFFVVSLVAFAVERILYLIMKKGFKRRRPPQAIPGFKATIIASDEFSFPSGHTSGAFLMATMASIYISPIMAIAYIWAASIGACRVILGVHFPTDTFMGAFIGTSVAVITSSLLAGLI